MVKGLTALRAVVVTAVAAGLVYGSNQVDVTADWSRSGDRAAARASTAAMNTTLVCPGPDRPGAPGQDQSPQRVAVSSGVAPTAWIGGSGAGSLQFTRLPADGSGAPQERTNAVENERTDLSGAAALRLTGAGSLARGVAALQYAVDDEPTVAGLVMNACSAPTKDAWLPIGGNQAGRLGRVVLTNPTQTPVTVDVAVVGHAGEVADKGANGVVVPPGDRVVVGVGDFDGSLADAMVHVTSRGGSVGVTGFDVWMTGETPSGAAASAPAQAGTDLILPAFQVTTGTPRVRVAVPGGEAATVRVRLVDADGLVVADEVQDVPAGATGSVAMQGVPAGWYALRVTSEQPVAAAAMTSAVATGRSDISWSTSADGTEGVVGTPLPMLPAGVRSTISLYSPDKPATVELVTTGDGGRTQQVQVEADRETRLEVTGRTGVWVRVRSGSVHAALASSGRDSAGPLLEVAALEPVVVKSDLRESTAELD